MNRSNAVCRIIYTYYGPDGSHRLYHGALTDGDAGAGISRGRIAVYVNGTLVSTVVTVFRSIGECGRAHGWAVAYRTDDGKIIIGEGGKPETVIITGNVEVLLDAEHPFAERIER